MDVDTRRVLGQRLQNKKEPGAEKLDGIENFLSERSLSDSLLMRKIYFVMRNSLSQRCILAVKKKKKQTVCVRNCRIKLNTSSFIENNSKGFMTNNLQSPLKVASTCRA